MAVGSGFCKRVSRRRGGGSWKKRFALRQGAEGGSAQKRARGWSSIGSFHAAAEIGGAERSWIFAAVNLSMTTIGPPHLGQRQRWFAPEVSHSNPPTLAGLSRIDRLQQRPMLAVMQRHVCPNGALRRHEGAPRASKARPGRVGKKVAAWVVERTS
jgi:hypothetical protein